jgi:hypothetical protein
LKQVLLHQVKKQPWQFSIRKLLGVKLAWPLHAYLNVRPTLFYGLINLLGRNKGGTIDKNTALVIAAAAGCGNTYALDAVKLGHSDLHFGSHQHIPVQVMQAKKCSVPCLVLIRHPMDSISSVVSRGGYTFSPEGLEWVLKDYSYFYNSIMDLQDSFVPASFQEVITDYVAVIRRLNERFGTNFSAPENDSKEAKQIVQKNKWKGTNRYHTLEDIQAALHSKELEPYRLKAEETYRSFCAATGLATTKDAPRPPVALASYHNSQPSS